MRTFTGLHKRIGLRGMAAVELALLLPLLFMILFGIIEFGVVIYDLQIITNASRNAVRSGIVASTPREPVATFEAVATGICDNLISFHAASCSVSQTGYSSTATSGTTLTVTVSYPYSFLILPVFASLVPASLAMASSTSMLYE
jgi:Flp pilus assembly protein TadG